MTQFSFEWILSLNWLCQKWGQVQFEACLLYLRDFMKAIDSDDVSTIQSLLCLTEDVRTTVPSVAGLQRYIISGVWSGLLFFGADGLLHVNAASPDPLRKQFEGTSLASMIDLVNNAIVQTQTQKPVLPPFPGIQK